MQDELSLNSRLQRVYTVLTESSREKLESGEQVLKEVRIRELRSMEKSRCPFVIEGSDDRAELAVEIENFPKQR